MPDATSAQWSIERFRDLVEQVPAVLYEAEPGRDGHWLYVSTQLTELIGDDPDTWVSDPGAWLARIHPDDREAVVATEAREVELARGTAVTYVSEYRMVRDDGSVVWIRDEARLAEDQDPPVWRGVLIDITKEHQAGAALDEAHARAGELVGAPSTPDDLATAKRQVQVLLEGIEEQMKVLDRGRRPEPRPGTSGTTRRVITSLDEQAPPSQRSS
jgi:PAS domain S-box-containing protein